LYLDEPFQVLEKDEIFTFSKLQYDNDKRVY